MAKRDLGDPFDGVADQDAISVPPGVFRAAGPAERTGSTNARAARGGPLATFRAASTKARLGWLTAVLLTALIVFIIPAGIALFGSVRKAQIEAEAAVLPTPALVVVSPEAQAVQDQIDQIDVAYMMSSASAEAESSQQMGALLDKAKGLVAQNDAAGAKTAFDEALAYFVTVYSQRLAGLVDPTIEEYWGLEWKTEKRLGELRDLITANADGHDLAGLVAAVIELPQQLNAAKNQHMSEYESYVPPASNNTKPSTQPAPTQTQAPTQAPAVTQAPPAAPAAPTPAPSTQPSTGNGNGNGNGGGNGNGNGNGGFSNTPNPKP